MEFQLSIIKTSTTSKTIKNLHTWTEVVDNGQVVEPVVNVKAVVETKRKLPSLAKRGSDGKVVRSGVNLSGNIPYLVKRYFIDPEVVNSTDWELAMKSCPKQVRAIVQTMVELDVDSEMNAKRGGDIVSTAKFHGFLTTKIGDRELFAYYRRVLETVGVRQA